MDSKQSQLEENLLINHDNERHGTVVGQPAGSIDEKPLQGYEFVPPVGTVPQPMVVQLMTKAIIKKINEMGAVYEGDRNSAGQKHGHGKVTYLDGSSYIGQFFEDKKEGEGRYAGKNDEYYYVGSWKNDMKHGNGEEKTLNGTMYKGDIFLNDRKHGQGQIHNGEWRDAAFINDLGYVLADQNPDSFGNAPLNILLCMATLFVAWVAYYFYENKWFLLGAIILYFIQLMEAFNCTVYEHLSNMMSYDELVENIKNGRDRAPKITMVYQNYHHYHEKGQEKRRNTECCREELRYYEFLDQSADIKSVQHVKATALTRVEFEKIVSYSVQASQSKTCQEHDFKQRSHKDEHGDLTNDVSIEGIIKHITVYRSQPLLCNTFVFKIFALFMQSWIIRVLFVFSSQRVTYDFQKYIVK
eukprot:403371400